MIFVLVFISTRSFLDLQYRRSVAIVRHPPQPRNGRCHPARTSFCAVADIPDSVSDDALDQRPEDSELLPSITVEDLRKRVRLAKERVLTQMKRKLIAMSDRRFLVLGFLALFWLARGVKALKVLATYKVPPAA